MMKQKPTISTKNINNKVGLKQGASPSKPKQKSQDLQSPDNNYNAMQSPMMSSPLLNSTSGYPGDYDPTQLMTYDVPEQRYANFIDNEGGESVKVALRIRPMSQLELSRGDEHCLKVLNDKSVQLSSK